MLSEANNPPHWLTIFDAKGRYLHRNYDMKSPFSSFLPGLAGLWGIPMSNSSPLLV